MENGGSRGRTFNIVFIGVMASIVFVVTFFRFPLLGSKVHFANTMCLLAGMLLGPVRGGLAAGIGSGLYDVLYGGYNIVEGLVTAVSKFTMAWVAGIISHSGKSWGDSHAKNVVASICGAFTYVALYMLRTLIMQRWLMGLPWDGTFVSMGTKLPASLINAALAIVAAPIINAAVRPALVKGNMLGQK